MTLAIACSSFGYETDFDDLKRFDRSLPAWKLGRQAWIESEGKILDNIDDKAKKINLKESAPFTSFRS